MTYDIPFAFCLTNTLMVTFQFFRIRQMETTPKKERTFTGRVTRRIVLKSQSNERPSEVVKVTL